jgi:hypothetical protein
MIKILFTPRHGGGWTSGHSSSKDDERFFMLTHHGLILALIIQELHDEADSELARIESHDWDKPIAMPILEACLELEALLREVEPNEDPTYQKADRFRMIPYEVLKALPLFVREWKSKFGTRLPHLESLRDVEIEEVEDLQTLRIESFDGCESVGYRPGIWG